ncbi:UvrD-helicase domain-containing protein [Belliella sp. DSM 111904]|uniref:DNA 3'-5' helicase II n=1 Tax=Belliella filtrata TaxID=2923435 RepID=A0ABS9V0K7_9BACT|nr:UvrD-helicase domain-containing protein [Belliella filtrata]MCH7409926.1 UvrD-helicase domain-containing protein [Belliella filtrata]
MRQIEISIEDIREAESLLLDKGESFGDEGSERIAFIRNLKICDLLAVPGSGKTTALLAKLYCLNKHLPFDDNSGILVLAHTNAAIDEIKDKLQQYCPKLFQYPNYIDTVQSFINRYLTVPRFIHKNGVKPYRIDSDFYSSEREKLLDTFTVISEVKHLFNTPKIDWLYTYSFREFEEAPRLRIVKSISTDEEVDIKKPKGKSKNYQDWNNQTKEKVTDNLIKVKTTIWDRGILSYDDSYLFASKHIDDFCELKTLLQKRFKYVFIDEMQDLLKHQIDIIDKIFFTKVSSSIIQRIGDKNQAIYGPSKSVDVESVWETRQDFAQSKYIDLVLAGTNRLTKEVAQIVDCLVLDRKPDSYKVIGKRILEKPVPPVLVVFSKEKKKELPALFKTIIKEHQQAKQIPIFDKYGNQPKFNLIAWSGEWNEERTEKNKDKIRLEDIVPYSREIEGKKEFLNSLSDHLLKYDKKKQTLEAIRKSILNGLIHILRLERKTYLSILRQRSINRFYTKSKMIEEIKERSDFDYDFFKEELYNWCWQTKTGNEKTAYNKIKDFVLNKFKQWFNLEINSETLAFLGTDFTNGQMLQSEIDVKVEDDLEVNVGTVHSVKGQTHCATMYVETSYYKYETEKIITPLFLEGHNCIVGKRDSKGKEIDIRKKEALKMMYVGFSRPTHLLCFAALEENVTCHIDNFKKAGWRIETRLLNK